jgi:hypothetical protein
MASSETEWGRMQQMGRQQYVLRGALRHGIPMAIGVALLIEVISGGTLSRERITSPEFLERLLLCLVVFSASGAISSFARWKSAESLFGNRA